MQVPIKHKRSAAPGSVPTVAAVALGELVLNTHDGKLFFKKNDGTESLVTVSVDGHGHAVADITGLEDTLAGLADASGISVDGNAVGYRNLPQASAQAAAYVLQASDVGKHVMVDAGGSIEVPDDVFALGDLVTLANNTDADVTLTLTITTAYLAGETGDKASLLIAARGLANVFFTGPQSCVVTGNVS